MRPAWRYLRNVWLAIVRPSYHRRLGEQAIYFAQKSGALENELGASEEVGRDLILILQEAQRVNVRLVADVATLNGYVARLEEKLIEHDIAVTFDG